MKRTHWLSGLAVVSLVVGACTAAATPVPSAKPTGPAASAATAAPTVAPTLDPTGGFRNGDQVIFAVPTNAGGGFDIQARILAPYLEKAFQDITKTNLKVLVENRPGASGRTGTEQMWGGPIDGKTIFFYGGAILGQQQVLDGANFDLTKATAYGMVPMSNRAFAVKKGFLPSMTFKAAVDKSKEKSLLIAHPGVELDLRIMFQVMKETDPTWDMKASYVAINGTGDCMTAVLRGDVQLCFSTGSAMRTFVTSNEKDLDMLVGTGCKTDVFDPKTPVVTEQNVPGAATTCATVGSGTRVIFGRPGIPDATAAVIRAAIKAALSNPEQIQKAAIAGYDSTYVSVEEEVAAIKLAIDTFTKYKSLKP